MNSNPASLRSAPRRRLSVAWWASAAVILAGCGGSDYELAAVKGTVVCQGKPVSSGTVTFAPIGASKDKDPGMPASASVQPDGTFVLSTYEDQDGAIVGTHRVTYTPPEDGEDEEVQPEVAEGSPEEARLNAERARKARERTRNACVQVEEKTFEVKSGEENTVTIELVPAATVRRSQVEEEE